MAEARPDTLHAVTGTTELHEPTEHGMIGPAWWVALAMVIVIALMLWKRVPALIAGMLDSKIAAIRTQLDEAKALRAEAEALLADAKARNAASAGDAEAIVRHAEAEAATLLAKAEADSADLIARRRKMAEDKIAAAERGAIAEVRAKAAEVAARAAAAVLAEQHGADADKALIDRSIASLGAGSGRPN